jgi:radical SAM protein with 4Fe4S-binding SPASM domain
MEILKDSAFFIKQETDNNCIFYNSIRHYACRIRKVDLAIFNLIYVYRNLDIIIKHIDKRYVPYVTDVYKTVIKRDILSKEPIHLSDTKELRYPDSYYLHLTYKCNLDCIYCYNKIIRTNFEELELTVWKSIIDKIMPFAKRIILTGGEPFLSGILSEIILYIRGISKSVDIEIISNCMTDFEYYRFTKIVFENINSVTFSCDNISGNSQQRHNFKPSLFKQNIRFLTKSFKKLSITVSSVYSNSNQNELSLIKKFCSNEKVGFQLVLMVPNNTNEICMLPSCSDYIKTLPNIEARLDALREYCGAGMGVLSIDPRGNVFPCQSLHRNKFKMGNLTIDSLNSILKSNVHKYIEENLNIDNIPMCKNCEVKYICGGGCRAATFNIEGDISRYPKTLCEYYKARAIHSLLNIPQIDEI